MKSNLTVYVHLQPEMQEKEIVGAKTVAQLLERLKIRQGTALVIRDKTPLTPDLHLQHGETLLVRKVVSSG